MIREMFEFIAIGLILLYLACAWAWRNIWNIVFLISAILMIIFISIFCINIINIIVSTMIILDILSIFVMIIILLLSIWFYCLITWDLVSSLEWSD